jgi:hypothetical protein
MAIRETIEFEVYLFNLEQTEDRNQFNQMVTDILNSNGSKSGKREYFTKTVHESFQTPDGNVDSKSYVEQWARIELRSTKKPAGNLQGLNSVSSP